MNEQTRIMCAVDLPWRSEGAFDYALALAESRRAPLDLLFAVSDRHPFGWPARERVAQLAEFRRRASGAGIAMKVAVQHGKPSDVILQACDIIDQIHTIGASNSPRSIPVAYSPRCSHHRGRRAVYAGPLPDESEFRCG
jgi:nucleotide-binding universal stress UspA family protein